MSPSKLLAPGFVRLQISVGSLLFPFSGYGILAILRLLFHIRYFYVLTYRQARFRLYCDSESLLNKIEASRKLKRTIPRRYLFSEVDVEMQILASIQSLASFVELEHVEGHQDTKYPGRPLPWEAQLNQHCDEIATAHLEAGNAPLPTVPFLPASQVSISVGAPTITHHIPTQLRNFAGLPGLRAYMVHSTISGRHRPSLT
jgi:hypothetical protein